ncbi:glycosyltransferase [Bacillus sp. X1(2014)]|uniref:glycosyltransferase family protein n=1 Tax=Bacillus sp. X1(2014) TaxID=1565991 RepID=UPI0011A7E3E3|nr:glycosyltransferase [Bacillus sp. X1(2014)]
MQKENLKVLLKGALDDIKKKREYVNSLNNLPMIKINGFSDFFIDTPVNISFNYSNQVINLEEESVYLSLFEKTTNFNKLPNNNSFALIGNCLNLIIDFNIFNNVTCTVYILFYDNEQNIHSINLKHAGGILTKTIKCPQNAKYYRFAIKLEGKGTFQIKEVSIEQKLNVSTSLYVPNGNSSENKGKSTLLNENKCSEFKNKIKNFRYKRKVKDNNLTVAAILDEFSYDCFKYDCNLIKLSKENWKKELEEVKPDFLFVESCWQGNNGEWAYEVANLHKNSHRTKLKELTGYCKEKNIVTLFWDKEGFENFNFFKGAAKFFDYIFTADENNITNFKQYTKNENIYTLAFAAQPQIHNPIYKDRNYMGQIAFGGSYYNNKHDARKIDMEQIIKPALEFDIQIFDRYFGTDPKKYPNNQWPEEYQKNIVGNLKYGEMIEAYKNYDIFINVNSVQNSKFMFARRVFEVLASRTMVLSGPSIGVEEMFNDLVPVAKTKEDTKDYLKIYLKNSALREKKVKEASRFVFTNHTYKNRLQQICDTIGLNKKIVKKPKATLIASTQRDEYMNILFESISSQTYPDIEVVVILNKNNMDIKKWDKKFKQLKYDVKIIQVDEQHSLGYCLNTAIQNSNGEIIAKIDDDDYYAPNYLTDMIISMDYSNADVVGKSSHYIYFEENGLLSLKTMGSGMETYSDFIAGATLVFKREVYERLSGFSDKNRGEDSDFLKRAKENGFTIYSNDQYNYCCLRRKNKDSHTWKVNDNELLRNSTSHSITLDYKTPITF